MAEFSKQWAEKNDPDFPWDFDILEVADSLSNESYLPYICEGYGFIAIGKTTSGDIILAIPDYNDDTVSWKTFNEVIN